MKTATSIKEFEHLYEAREWFRQYRRLTDAERESTRIFWYDPRPQFKDQPDPTKPDFGDWILFQHIDNIPRISRPIFGIVAGYSVWDMALVLHVVEQLRAVHCRKSVLRIGKNGMNHFVGERDPETEAFEFWTGDIHVLGSWKSKPTWSELRRAASAAL